MSNGQPRIEKIPTSAEKAEKGKIESPEEIKRKEMEERRNEQLIAGFKETLKAYKSIESAAEEIPQEKREAAKQRVQSMLLEQLNRNLEEINTKSGGLVKEIMKFHEEVKEMSPFITREATKTMKEMGVKKAEIEKKKKEMSERREAWETKIKNKINELPSDSLKEFLTTLLASKEGKETREIIKETEKRIKERGPWISEEAVERLRAREVPTTPEVQIGVSTVPGTRVEVPPPPPPPEKRGLRERLGSLADRWDRWWEEKVPGPIKAVVNSAGIVGGLGAIVAGGLTFNPLLMAAGGGLILGTLRFGFGAWSGRERERWGPPPPPPPETPPPPESRERTS
jgi:hypothetical protein